jgi:alkylhydroperoxidase/carboxymuconolactone decarboxylase family protein YurZ
MPLEGHWARQHAPLGRRERRLLAALAALAALGLVLVLSLHGSARSSPGCIDATIASTTGGAAIHACGERARRLCASDGLPASVRERCRRAGLK